MEPHMYRAEKLKTAPYAVSFAKRSNIPGCCQTNQVSGAFLGSLSGTAWHSGLMEIQKLAKSVSAFSCARPV